MIKSKSNFTAEMAALVISCALAVFFAPPVTAQTAKKLKCNGCVKSKQLKNNGIKGKDIMDGQVNGNDLNPNIALGTSGDDGDLSVKSTAGTLTVSLDGDTGTVTNSLTGDGLVKAWARIAADGTILSCYRCNLSTAETRKVNLGRYEVDFTPLSTDIRGRPRTATIDGGSSSIVNAKVSVSDRIGILGPPPTGGPPDHSSVFVSTSAWGIATPTDAPFIIVIY